MPGAFETADTFARLGATLGTDHRVFAIDLTGTGYSQPSPPFTASHLAAQLVAFLAAMRLTGANAPVIVGHSSGAAVAGLVALRGSHVASFIGGLLIDAYRTTILRRSTHPGSSGRSTAASAARPARR